MSNMLEKLQKLVAKSDDLGAECLLDANGIDYKEVSDTDWIDDGKYQFGSYEVEIDGEFFSFSMSRNGSHYTDWYVDIQEVSQYVPDTRYHMQYTFPNKGVAQAFVSWMSDAGEQFMWQDAVDSDEDLSRSIEYNYEKGSLEIGERFNG